MDILFFTIPLALVLALVFIGIFILSVRWGQYDDLKTPSFKILLDDEKVANNKNNSIQKDEKEQV